MVNIAFFSDVHFKPKVEYPSVHLLNFVFEEHREMMKTIKDLHEKRTENEQRKIEIMSELVEAMKNQ